MTTPYLMQPDTNSVCCDCSQRTSPCDDCACTATVSAQTSSVYKEKFQFLNDDYNSRSSISIPKYWNKKTIHKIGSYSHSTDGTVDETDSVDWTWVSEVNAADRTTVTDTYTGGSQAGDGTAETCNKKGEFGDTCFCENGCSGGNCDTTANPSETFAESQNVNSIACTYDSSALGHDYHIDYAYTVTATFSDEYTTAQLTSDAQAAMPAYAANTLLEASLTLDSLEDRVAITKLKYTITPPPGKTASWNVVFTPPGGSPAPTAMSCTSAQTYEIIPAQSGSWIVQDIACS